MNRAIFYIDGFNLYHSFTSNEQKWLDLKKLSLEILSKNETLAGIYYFSALCSWNLDKRERHEKLIRIYRSHGIHVVLGRFKEMTVECTKKINRNICDHRYIRHTEKQTDVNIAVQIVKDAYEENMERAYIISRDSDLIPAIRVLRALHVNTMIVFPPETMEVEELKRESGMHRVLKRDIYKNAILPDEVEVSPGDIITRPDGWI